MHFSIKDTILKVLNESSDYTHVDADTVSHVIGFGSDRKKDTMVIDFMTTYGKPLALKVRYSGFKDWFSKSKKEIKASMLSDFVKQFLTCASEVENEEEMMEIVDKNGDLYGDDDEPMNGTNSMVGMSNKDTEYVYRRTVPKSVRMYSGDLGIGIITW